MLLVVNIGVKKVKKIEAFSEDMFLGSLVD